MANPHFTDVEMETQRRFLKSSEFTAIEEQRLCALEGTVIAVRGKSRE